MKRSLPALLTILSAVPFAGRQLPGQAPRGLPIVSAFNPGLQTFANRNGMPGGLFVLHPRTPTVPLAVTGLPLQLTGQGVVGLRDSVGCSGIALLPDGDLLVGECTPRAGSLPGVNADLEVHRVRLTWTQVGSGANPSCSAQVVQSFRIATVLATATLEAEVTDVEVLPGATTALVSIYGTFAAPMTGHRLALLGLTTGGVTAIPVTGLPGAGVINALAASADGQVAYLGAWFPGGPGSIWTMPLSPSPSGNATVLPTSTTIGNVMAMDRDNQGDLLVGTADAGSYPGGFHVVDTVTGAVVSPLPVVGGTRNAVLVERNTGSYFVGRNVLLPGSPTLTSLLLGTAPWGLPAGLALRPAVESFGAGSTCVSTGTYEWQTTPNPGGIPLVGAPNFSITVQTPAPQSVCLFAFALGEALAPIPLVSCASLLLDPGTLAPGPLQIAAGGATAFTAPLPIPNNALLADLTLTAQSFHLAATGPDVVESAPGLEFTIR